MKKLISIILILALFGISPAFANETDESISNTLEFLKVVGLAEDYEVESLQESGKITRAVFADNIAKLIGKGEQECNRVYYHDVPKDYWGFNSIGILTEMGVVSGAEENIFNPDDIITKTEALKILLSVLGYDQYAAYNGGYPTGYTKAAARIGLDDNLMGANELTMADMLTLMRNALLCDICTWEPGSGGFKLTENEDKTLLSECYGMYIDKGVVTGFDGLDISDMSVIGMDEAVIDGRKYKTQLSGNVEYLGEEVEYIYHEDSKADERELIWLKPTGKTESIELWVDADDSFDVDGYNLSHRDSGSGRSRNYKISKGVTVIYNGSFVTENIDSIFGKDKYSLKLVKTENSGGYDLAVVKKYENYVASYIDSEDKIIYSSTYEEKSLSLNEDDYDTLKIHTKGVAMDFSEIKKDYIISAYLSHDGTRLEAEVSAETKQGVTESAFEYNSDSVIVIDSQNYIFYDNNTELNINVGEEVVIYIDARGFVARIKTAVYKSMPVYLIRTLVSDEENCVYLKVLTTSGEIVKYKCAPGVNIDSRRYEGTDMKDVFLSEDKTARQIMIIDLNSEGEIKKIDTTDPGNESDTKNTLKLAYTASGTYRNTTAQLGFKTLLSSNTVIFGVPTPSNDDVNDNDFVVKKRGNLRNDGVYTAKVYRYKEEFNGYEELLVIEGQEWNSYASDSSAILVESIKKGLNSEEDIAEYIVGYQGTNMVEIYADGKFTFSNKGIKSGDLIRVKIDSSGFAKDASIVYSHKSGKLPSTKVFSSSFRTMGVYAHDKIGNVLKTGYNSGAEFDEIFNMASAKIVVYDEDEKPKVRIGTMADIKTYKMLGDACSIVIAQTKWAEPQVFVVYN